MFTTCLRVESRPNERPRPPGRGGIRALAAVLAVFTMAGGCSRKDDRVIVYPVSGKVTVLGEVPEGALVVFYPAQSAGESEVRPSGKVKQDGSFRLTTFDADDGAPSGDYVATIQWNKLVKRGSDHVAGPNVVPPDYAKRETSPWKVKVADATNELTPLAIAK